MLAGPGLDDRVPYVLATDVVRTEAGAGFDVAEIARVVAVKLVEEGTPLAARCPCSGIAVVELLVDAVRARERHRRAPSSSSPAPTCPSSR